MGRISGNMPSCSLCLEGKIARCAIIDWFMGWGKWFGWMETWLENLWQRILDRGMWKTSLNAQRTWKHCVPCECSQRETSAEEDFSNQVDEMTHHVDTSPTLSHPMGFLHPLGLWQRGHSGGYGGRAWAQQHGLPFSWPGSGSGYHWMLHLPPVELNTKTLMWHHFPQTAVWWQVDHIRQLPKWQHFVLTYSEDRFAFPAYNTFAKLASKDS